ncbi:sigma-70 family RNA polymerase sigma factor [Rhodanobacter sp. DHG33]|uniref:sigma-70 family RNA polymerase sigma factor n=1 Tax=Rhodanobacter sp. DHG33 TaxID=2775921 RepID=UPI001785FCE1|nr:sigma-70 family RNA polymerase sigma factor [Rhodanobacter sp. DHG33]MBD8898144.1 sigma-70 family RNA polymerase sigma factor [Rhodanobacter sp. DHG33]
MPIEASTASPPLQPAISARFEAVVLPWLDAAWNLARWLAHNDADAQDVVQEAMLRALRYFDSFRGGDARVWLLAIVRNTYFTLSAKTPPGHLLEPLDEDLHPLVDEQASPEALTLLAVDVGSLRQALERLPPPWREAIVLRELEECSYKEIATITGQKIGTVMSRLARARERLKLELSGQSGEAP